MDLKVYYQKIRDEQARITDEFPIVVSLETPDGGKPGCCTEVPRAVAAKMITEGSVRLADAKEAEAYRDAQAKARAEAEAQAAASKMEVKFISAAELTKLQSKGKE